MFRTAAFGLLISLSSVLVTNAQTTPAPPRQLRVKKTNATIKIDGNLSDPAWKEAIPLDGFIERRPNFGAPIDSTARTEMYMLYDNNNIYFSGYFHEKSADSISKELVGRDGLGTNDYACIIIDTYNDKINANGFFVTPLGEQLDSKYSLVGGEDFSWNGVWDTETQIHKDGWTFEVRIPYSCLRFANKDGQTWGINLFRGRTRTGQQYVWDPIYPTINGFISQEGEWVGIEKIKPPVRLSFSPYFSTYINHYPYDDPSEKNLTGSINGGMDVKYGINESFTLDMTLIPDFGQVQSDNKVLNLTPFEVKYNENRSFFTEGTELFNKGNLFYSRRIGGQPLHLDEVPDQIDSSSEKIIKNPAETKLINATKISGRNRNGLGIGFFNAIAQPVYATIEDDAHRKRKIKTNPLTNYNILVLDQSLKNNSSVSLINTSVWRSGKDYDANVTAALADFNTKTNMYNWNAKFAVSTIKDNGKATTGYTHLLSFGKPGGRFNFKFSQELVDDKFDPNDLGILFNNNFLNHSLWVGYKWVKPGKWFNNLYLNLNNNFSHRFKGSEIQSYNINTDLNGQLKNLAFAGVYISYLTTGNDFYESHLENRVFKTPSSIEMNIWYNGNEAKKYLYGGSVTARIVNKFNSKRYLITVYNRYRFSDKFSIRHDLSLHPVFNEAGFANPTYIDGFDSAFSRRNWNTVENTIAVKYNFNKRSGITFRARHYWSVVRAKEFFTLNMDGTLSKDPAYRKNVNQNFNAFTIDMVYSWEFNRGSFLNLVWKNSIYGLDNYVERSYFKNVDNLFSNAQSNSLSLKILYYLDYIKLRRT